MATMTGTAIRSAILARVQAAGIVPAGHVYDTRLIPFADGDAPVISVYIRSSRSDRHTLNSQIYRTTYTMAVHGIVTTPSSASPSGSTLAQAADEMEAAILHALLDDPSWANTYEMTEWTGTDRQADWEGDRMRESVIVLLDVTATEIFEPSGLETFDTVHHTTEIATGTPDTPPVVWEDSI